METYLLEWASVKKTRPGKTGPVARSDSIRAQTPQTRDLLEPAGLARARAKKN
jgi:hypothetical protein